jgi:hypothetical protein
MSKETRFFIYLIERYAEYKNTTAEKILQQWEDMDLVYFIYDMYELYHVERLENAFDDIDKLMSEHISMKI